MASLRDGSITHACLVSVRRLCDPYLPDPTIGTLNTPQELYCFADPSILVTSRAAIPSGHDRWCFLNEDHIQPFTTLEKFKRHMREHHPQFHCIVPQERQVTTEDGRKCVCGFDNPDLGHFKKHDVPGCDGKKFTRKENLIKHLENAHQFHDGSALADQSKRPIDQKHFACGFCVCHCESLDVLIDHIDCHYRDLKHIRDWDDNKVIQGLLSQADDYRRSFETRHLPVLSLTWHPTHAKILRHRLEMCQEPVDILVQAAINQIDKVKCQHGHVNSASVTGDGVIDTSHSLQTFQREEKLTPLALTSRQGFLLYDPVVTASTPHSQRLPRGYNGFNNLDWHIEYDGHPSPQIASKTYGPSASTMCPPADHIARPYRSQIGGESFVQHQHPAYVSSNASASYKLQSKENQAKAFDYSPPSGYSPDVSGDVAAHPGSTQAIEMNPYLTQAYHGFLPLTLASQSASSSLSADPETSPLLQLNRPYSPHYPNAPANISMDMSFDLDSQQRSVQDQTLRQHQ